MNKKYTFFVSSTFSDLIEERKIIVNQILEFDEIPVGMEQFGSIDAAQWSHITRLIDTSDYYVLIVAGKYGFIDPGDPDGLSYTHREFRYARDIGVPVIAIVHSDPDVLPAAKSETDQVRREKLETFRSEVKSGRLVSFYTNYNELIQRFSTGFVKAKTYFNRHGWIRNINLLPEDEVKELVVRLQERVKLLENANYNTAVENSYLRSQITQSSTQIVKNQGQIKSSLDPLKELEKVSLAWFNAPNSGQISIAVKLETLFIMIAMLIHKSQLKLLSDARKFTGNIGNQLARIYARDYTGEGTTFSLYQNDMEGLLTKFISMGLLQDGSDGLRISDLGVALLDWLE